MTLESNGSGPEDWAATNMNFRYVPMEKQKTDRWEVMTKDNVIQLGVVKWFASWRRYCFFPSPETVFEQDCMRDLAEFVEERTRDHKEGI